MKTLLQNTDSLLVHFHRAREIEEEATDLTSINLNHRQLCDLELLLNRAFYPLDGYLDREDYESVLSRMRLVDGTLWPMPICLDVDASVGQRVEPGQSLCLRDGEGFLLALLEVRDIWRPDKMREAEAIYQTTDAAAHPGVRTLFETHEYYVSGRLEGIQLPLHYDFKELRLTPSEIHRRFREKGWKKVIGFHTEKYLHCAHKEMVSAAAREAGASILLHPVVGLTHPGDIDHYTQVRCYQHFVKRFPSNMIILGLLPLAARKAGPREALWQALIRRNFGCTHFMTAADQGDPYIHRENGERFYPLHTSQELILEHQDETGIQMTALEKMVYAEDKAQYIKVGQVFPSMNIKEISSSELRHRLQRDLPIPAWFSYPEIVNELKQVFVPRSQQGFTIFLTGLSGSGKSTIAKVLLTRFLEIRGRPVTLLDGDIVRNNLSSELSFSKEHRNLNVTRIGFVASEITKNHGIAICAPIAPYDMVRRQNRELISQHGGYIEVYVSTPLEVCEQRDRKGLYAKARKGIIKGVTGIDDPYEPPVDSELVIDTTDITPEEAAQEILLYLEKQGYLVS